MGALGLQRMCVVGADVSGVCEGACPADRNLSHPPPTPVKLCQCEYKAGTPAKTAQVAHPCFSFEAKHVLVPSELRNHITCGMVS